jgi:membrane protein DedA with SNARE-associated domain
MEQWITSLAYSAPYLGIFGVLLLSGFGLPVPEDLPLVIGGYLAAKGYADPWILFGGSFVCIMGADATVFWLGRTCGHHVPRIPILRRWLTEQRVARAEVKLHEHGGKVIFTARFLPGLRAPAMFAAGSCGISYWRFLFFDGAAALVSVPVVFWLAWGFADHIDVVKDWIAGGQIAVIILIVTVLAAFISAKIYLRRRLATGKL